MEFIGSMHLNLALGGVYGFMGFKNRFEVGK